MLVSDIEDRKTWRSNRATSHDIFRVDIIFSNENTEEEVADEVLTPTPSRDNLITHNVHVLVIVNL